MKSNRNLTADLLKGIAVFFMVMVHILELFSSQDIFTSSIGSVVLFLGGPPAAPVFMIVMGFFLAKNNLSIEVSVARGLKLILLGFALNIALNFHLLLLIVTGKIVTSPWPYVFGVDILFLAGLSIILIGIINQLKVSKLLISVVLISVIFIIQQFFDFQSDYEIIRYLLAYVASNEWWSYFPLVPWIVYPLTGYAYFNLMEKDVFNKIRKSDKIITLISLLILILTIRYGVSIASELQLYYHHNYFYYLFTINLVIILSYLAHRLSLYSNNKIVYYLQWLGKHVTVYYVIQWILIGNIATAIYKTQNLWQSTLWFVIIVALSSLLTFFWIKLKMVLFSQVNS